MSDWLNARHGYRPQVREGYDVMQACESGHVVNTCAQTMPQFSSPFCAACGAQTIIACQSCGAAIRGTYHAPGVIWAGGGSPPKFCHQCGQSYPWTVAQLAAADDLISDLDNLTPEEKHKLTVAVRDLAAGGPREEVGVSRFKKLAAKAGASLGGALYKVAIDVATDAAKKGLLGG